MRAAVVSEQGATPTVAEFDEPRPVGGSVLVHVETAGLGGWDVLGRYILPVQYPCVVRGEGVGHTDDGRRVYFGERSVPPFGAWAERTIVPAEEVWDVPDGVDDKLAITMAIAGTGALVPLESARIEPGESVLIVGATGAVGQIALQLARHLGAGLVVGAARNEPALRRLLERGLTDAVVAIGTDNDAERLKASAGEGFDVVLDMIYGDAFLAALKATRPGARVVTMGAQNSLTADLNILDLFSRTHSCVGTGHLPPAQRRAIWERLLGLAREHKLEVDYTHFTLERATEAWTAQLESPRAKVVATIG